MTYQIAPDFCLPSRRGNRRIASYVTVAVTRKASKKTSKMVFHLTEIALVVQCSAKGFLHLEGRMVAQDVVAGPREFVEVIGQWRERLGKWGSAKW